MWSAVLWSVAASAAEPNGAANVHLEVVHALGRERPWGVRLGANWHFSIGDHCEYNESDGCRNDGIWPLVGPAFAVTWHGRDAFAFDVNVDGGVGRLEMAHHGFLPMWEVVAKVGFRFETGEPTAGVLLGGFVSKSFGLTLPNPGGGTRSYGTHAFGLRFDTDTAWVFGEGWRAPTLAGGLWSFASPVSSEYNLHAQ